MSGVSPTVSNSEYFLLFK